MDDALKLAREFEHAMCRFRRMDYSALHPGVGNMEFAVLEMIHKLSAQHDAIYGAAISDLQKKMEEAAEALEFEEAARYRDLFNSVKQVSQKQKITDSDGEDKDIIALDKDGSDAVVQVFFVRSGKLIGREHFYMTHVEDSDKAQILLDFVKQFYAGTPFVPRELILQKEIDDIPVLEEWLTARRGARVYIRVPRKGQKEKLVELAEKNAKLVLEKDRERIARDEARTVGAVRQIAAAGFTDARPDGGVRYFQHQRL